MVRISCCVLFGNCGDCTKSCRSVSRVFVILPPMRTNFSCIVDRRVFKIMHNHTY